MKRVLKILTVLLMIWLGFTFYFITQHHVSAKEAKINKTVVFDDVTIELDSLVFYNFKRKRTNIETDNDTKINKFKYKLLSKLPNSLVMPSLRIVYLYSSPYEIDNRRYTTALFGKCMFTQHVNDSTEYNEFKEYNDYFRNNLSIYMVDSIGVGYSNGSGTEYEDNSHEIDFSTRGRNFPIERFQDGIKVIIKHLGSGEVREFKIDSQDFIDYKHNDFFGKAFPFHLDL